MTIRVGINGFGRIGRCVMRAALGVRDIEIVHVNDLIDTKTLAHLLKYDSVHGALKENVYAESEYLVIGNQKIGVSAVRDPAEIPWKARNVDIVFECTGIFRKKEQAEKHIKAGARKVIVSSPATGEDLTVVMGVNHHKIDKAKHTIISNGSCTTN